VKFNFKEDKIRKGRLELPHGVVASPFFMPTATKGVLKGLTPDELEKTGTQIALANTYHLHLRPGEKLIKKRGGLHQFMGWKKPILTDSGGYQVFSLGLGKREGKRFVKISEEGVEFKSYLDGSNCFLTPEKATKVQMDLGSDIAMCFDECPPSRSSKNYVRESLEMTLRWAERCKKVFKGKNGEALFGIIQGGLFEDLRKESALESIKIGFSGYAIGGLAVGEGNEEMYDVLEKVVPLFPKDAPRYLMGVGKPENILEAVKRGVDMFDCVLPTRNSRHGFLYVFKDRKKLLRDLESKKISQGSFYEVLRIKSQKSAGFKPIDEKCGCYTCRNFSREYLRYLFLIEEQLGKRLATIHNLAFYMEMMKLIRGC
jgi:queuine tRNA-ribosyltransferase